jgi:hypothetical protein
MFDSRVLAFGAELYSQGEDPHAERYWGVDGIVYNYPSAWRFLTWMGVTRSNYLVLGFALAVLFLGCLWLVIPVGTPLSAAVHLAIVFSPPALNALGQGNGELLVIALLGVGMLWAKKESRGSEIAAPAVVFLASLLKLYPAVCLLPLWARRGGRKWLAVLFLVAFLSLLLWKRGEIRSVLERTPEPFAQGFGCLVIANRADNLLRAHSRFLTYSSELASIVTFASKGRTVLRLGFVVLVMTGIFAGWRRALRGGSEAVDLRLAFGAALYLGAFGIGSSWSYRMLVLVFCLAGLVGEPRLRPLLWFLLAVLWSSTLTSGVAFVVEQALQWGAVAALSYELGRFLSRELWCPLPLGS